MRVIVTGVPGVGKSTLMEAAAKAKNLKIVNFGTAMFETAKERGMVKDRDSMRKLPLDKQREIQIGAAEKIFSLGDTIVDTHATVKTQAGFLPGLPAWVLEKLRPDIIFLVEAPSADIHKRRSGDPTRQRDAESAAEIDTHQQMNRAAGMAYAALTGATVKIVVNADGKVKEGVDMMMAALM